MSRLKEWLMGRFLPAWCREELLRENEGLAARLEEARQANRELQAYIKGMRHALKARSIPRGEARP